MLYCLILFCIVQVVTQRVVNFEAGGVEGGRVVGTPGGFDDASTAVFSTEQVYEGMYSAKNSIREGQEGFGTFGGIIDFPQNLGRGGEVWMRLRAYFPSGWSFSANPWLKFMRIHTTSPQNSNEGYDDWYIYLNGQRPYQFIYEGEQVWYYFGTKNQDEPNFDVWETYEMYVRFDSIATSQGGQALVRFWKNGLLIGESRDRRTLASNTTTAESAYIFTYWNGGAPKNQSMYLDDIKIQFTQPGDRDAQGNPYIGMEGNSTTSSSSSLTQPTTSQTIGLTSSLGQTTETSQDVDSSVSAIGGIILSWALLYFL